MDFVRIGWTVGLIAAVAAVVSVLGGRRPRVGPWAALSVLAAAAVVADRFLPTNRWPALSTRDADQRVVLAIVPLAVLAGLTRRLPAWARGLLTVAATAGLIAWMASAYPGSLLAGWPGRLAVPAAVAGVAWALVEPLAIRRPTGPGGPWACGCLAGGVGLLNLFSTSTSPGWTAVAVGGVMAGLWAVSLAGRGTPFAAGPVAVVVPVLVGLAMANRLNDPTDVPAWQWLLLAAAPAAAWAAEPLRRAWVREPLRAVLVAVPVVLAVVPSQRQAARQQAAETPSW